MKTFSIKFCSRSFY